MALLLVGTNGYTEPLTNAQIRAVIIRQSIASYPGTCACPNNVARNGSSAAGVAPTAAVVAMRQCAMQAMCQMLPWRLTGVGIRGWG